MNLYNLVNEDEFLESDISLYLFSEDAEDLIDEIYDNDEYIENFEYYEEVLDENEIVIVSKVRGCDGWFVEPLCYEDGQIYNEVDICVIQGEILEELDFDKIKCDEVVILKSEIEEENVYEVIEDILEEMIDELSDESNCPHCVMKDALKESFNLGRLNVLSEIEGHTESILDSINN